MLCADSITLFESELRRVELSGVDPHAPPSSIDLSVESPFFNRYASPTPSLSEEGGDQQLAGDILAVSSLPAANASRGCRSQCGARWGSSRCIAAVISSSSSASAMRLRVRFFCLPDPSLILATLYPLSIDGFDLDESDTMQTQQGFTFTHVELVWEAGDVDASLYVLVYAARVTNQFTFSSAAPEGGETGKTPNLQFETSHEVFVWTPDGGGGARRARVLGTDDLAAGVLTPQIQRALFSQSASSVLLLSPQVGTVAITSAMPVRTGVVGQIVLQLSFSAQIQGISSSPVSSSTGDAAATVSTDSNAFSMRGYALEAIVTWCDPRLAGTGGGVSSLCRSHIDFFAPCASASPACAVSNDPTCGGTCNRGLDAVLRLADGGTFVAVWGPPLAVRSATSSSSSSSSTTTLLAECNSAGAYLYLPSGLSSATASGFSNLYNYNRYDGASPVVQYPVFIDPYLGLCAGPTPQPRKGGMGEDPLTLGLLGTWYVPGNRFRHEP